MSRTRPRPKTVAPRHLTREEQKLRDLLPVIYVDRPQSRAECEEGPRPCPFVSCKHHLYLDVNPETGSLRLTFPDKEVDELEETCSLDVAMRDGATLEQVGELVNLTRERIRQIEVRGLVKLRSCPPGEEPLPGDNEPPGFVF